MLQLERGSVWTKTGVWIESVVLEENGAQVRTARVSCPNCGAASSIRDHEIAADGTVSPSLICPSDCGFHDFVQLVGWGAT